MVSTFETPQTRNQKRGPHEARRAAACDRDPLDSLRGLCTGRHRHNYWRREGPVPGGIAWGDCHDYLTIAPRRPNVDRDWKYRRVSVCRSASRCVCTDALATRIRDVSGTRLA